MRRVRTGLIALLLMAAASPSAAQVFGKNKVQYAPLDWSVLETPHLRLHYYAEEESLARHLAVFAESVCVEYDGRVRLPKRPPVPFLLYSVHHLFQQTNATPGFVSEGTGGLTELIKGRVLLPHTGSWKRLRWVTRHELTHSYMLEKISRVMKDHKRSQGYLPPLWFIEGLAEYCGTTWDEDAEGLLRDAVVHNVAQPLTQSEGIAGTVLMYKEGQSFLMYLADRYGDQRIFDMFDQWYRAEDFETLFKITYGVPLKDVDEEWFDSIKRHYFPAVATAESAPDVAFRLTPHDVYSLGPRVLPAKAASDTALRFCYFAASPGSIDLVLSEPTKGGPRKNVKVLRGGASPQFESFHLFENRPDVSTTGLIAVTSKRGGQDALYIVDSRKHRVIMRMEFPRLVSITNPALVPGDTACVFSAQDMGGRRDLYRARWVTKNNKKKVQLERLTNDDYDDLDPDVSPDGAWVVFASDRCDRDGHYSLFRMSLAGGKPEMVSDPERGDDRQPVYSPDGHWIAFRSTRGGTSDLWIRGSEPSLEARRVTHLLGPAYDPDWLPSGHGLVFTGQNGIRFHTYALKFNPDTLRAEPELSSPRRAVLPVAVSDEEASKYQRRLSLDLASNAISLDPGMTSAGGGSQIALSVVLGNEQLYILIANDSERFGSFWDGFEVGATYVNRTQRLNWGLGLFRLTEIYDANFDEVRREKRIGMLGLASYPFSKFTRVEGQVLIRHAANHLLRSGPSQDAVLVSNYLAFVHDNSRWTEMGPSGGTRTYLSAGFTRDLNGGQGDYTSLLAEYRHYAMPLPSIVLAGRVQAQSSFGEDAQRYYLGGWTSIRGFERRSLSGEQTVLAQTEVRFPLLRGLTLAFPTMWMFPTVGGAVFADAALTWDRYGRRDPFMRDVFGRPPDYEAGSYGASFYIGGGYVPAFRWDYVWRTYDIRHFSNFSHRPLTRFSFAYNF
jgi:hypothetical protein